MDKKIFIANWKSNKNQEEAEKFLDKLKESSVDFSNKEVIIAPSFTALGRCKELIRQHNLPIETAGQNVSPFPEGAYTGEVSAKQLKELADYVIIGHSERRRYFHEELNVIENKVREAKEVGLKIVQCVQDERDTVCSGVEIVAYEPPSAIGSGNPDDPEHISYVFEHIKKDYPYVRILYGGSVNPENISDFMNIDNLSGFLIGGASLEVESFTALLDG